MTEPQYHSSSASIMDREVYPHDFVSVLHIDHGAVLGRIIMFFTEVWLTHFCSVLHACMVLFVVLYIYLLHYLPQSDKLYLECDVFLTHAQVGRDAAAGSSTGDFFLVERKCLPIELVLSVNPSDRPHVWYRKGGRWRKLNVR